MFSMTWLQLINNIYRKVGQRMASELYDDGDIILAIQGAIDLMDATTTWGFNNDSLEFIAPDTTSATVFTSTDYDLYKVYKVYWYLTSTTIDWDAKELEQVQFIDRDSPETSSEFVQGINTITTSKEYYKVVVQCNHSTKKPTNTEVSKVEAIPLSSVLVNGIREHALALLMPTFIDTGYELAVYHEKKWDTFFKKGASFYKTQNTNNTISVKWFK